MTQLSWIGNGPIFKMVEGSSNYNILPSGIYNVNLSRDGWHLEKAADKFIFNYKVYPIDQKFFDHVIKAYKNTKTNFGIILNGSKGAGKSQMAKTICNELNLPVILMKSFNENNDSLLEYLSSFNFECILLFDEFEKEFDPEDPFILKITDGVYSSEHKKLIILTTNEMEINSSLFSRPSRIRYIKQFDNLEKEIVYQYLEDNLDDKTFIDDLIEYIDTLQLATIDILKTIVEEINLFGFEEFKDSKSFFNIQNAYYVYDSYFITIYNKYSIPKEDVFLKAIELKKRNRSNSVDYDLEDRIKDISDDIDYQLFISSKKFFNLTIGDKINGYFKDNEIIAYINTENHIVITTYNNFHVMYYIANPSIKPSIYNKNTLKLSL